MTGHPTAAVCRALHVARATAYLRPRPREGPFYRRAEDREVLLQIMDVVRERASYGVRRIHALVIRQLPVWLDDYNQNAPHSALKQKSPREWRAEKTQTLGV